MKYLITGAAGFIGSHLAKRVVEAGYQVVVIDNLMSGNVENMQAFTDKVEFLNVSSGQAINHQSCKGLDGIFHLGIPSTTKFYRENPMLVGEAINDFISILELCKRENCKLVYASSSSVYNGLTPPFTEDREILVKDYYTEARLVMERMAKLYNDFFGVKSIGFRFFSVYGPNEIYKRDFANLVSQFIWAMSKNEQPVIYGDGTQTRDFTFVEDIVSGFLLGMEKPVDFGVYNLGTGTCYSLLELVKILNQKLGKNLEPKFVVNPLKNYVNYTLANTEKVAKEMGWSAQISLEKGIDLILQAYKEKGINVDEL